MRPSLRNPLQYKSVWALADQAVVSAGNFATSLLLARRLVPAEFGTFVLLTSACLIVFGLHVNLIACPLVVLAAPESESKARSYTTVALTLSAGILPLTFLVVFGASADLHREVAGLLAVLYAVAWQLQETLRRALFAKLRYRDAIWGDAISYLGQALLVGLLVGHKGITLEWIFVMMAATSLAAAALQWAQARPGAATWAQLSEDSVEYWRLGKWLLVASIAGALTGPFYPWLLNWFRGKEAAAMYQALMNVVNIVNPVVNSVGAIMIPVGANYLLTRRRPGARPLLNVAIRYVLGFELLLTPVWLFLGIWPHTALTLFYGKTSIYVTQTYGLRVAVLACILLIPAAIFLYLLTGAGNTKSNAIAYGVGAATSVVCAPPLIFLGGVVGGMWATTLSRAACVLQAVRLLRTHSGPGNADEASIGYQAPTEAGEEF